MNLTFCHAYFAMKSPGNYYSRAFWGRYGISVAGFKKKLDKRFANEKKQFERSIKPTKKQQDKIFKLLKIQNEQSKNYVLLFCLQEFFERRRNAIEILFKSKYNAALFIKLTQAFVDQKKRQKVFDKIKYYTDWIMRGSDRTQKIFNFDKKIIPHLKKAKANFGRKLPAGKGRNFFTYKTIFADEFGDYYLHLITKKTQGRKGFEPIKGFAINKKTGLLELTADVDIEFQALIRALEKEGVYIDRTDRKNVNASNLLSWLSGQAPNNDFALTEAKFNSTQLGGDVTLNLQNKKGKDDISPELNQLSQRQVSNSPLSIKDVSSFSFYHKKRRNFVNVWSNYGAYRLNLFNRKVSQQRRRELESDFETSFSIPLNEFIEKEIIEDEKKSMIKEFLEFGWKGKNRPKDRLSKQAEKIYVQLVELGLLKEPIKKELKKTCATKGCPYYQKKMWGQKRCPDDGCKKPLILTGANFIFEKDLDGIYDYVLKQAKDAGYKTEIVERIIRKKPHKVIQLTSADFAPLFIYISAGKKMDNLLLSDFQRRCPNLFVIHFEFPIKEAQLQENLFFSKHLFDLVWNYEFEDSAKKQDFFKEAIENQKLAWKQKITANANQSVADIKNKQNGYEYENFEFDCFSLIHYLTFNAVWLGSKKRGVSVPDGAAFFNVGKGQCLAWDCKLGRGKGKRRFDGKKEGSAKFTKYIADLKSNKTIRNLGGLKGFAIIASKPNEKNFLKVFKEVRKKSRGVSVFLILEDALVELFDFYKANEKAIDSDPAGKSKFNEWLSKILFKKQKPTVITKKMLETKKQELTSALTPQSLEVLNN